MKAIQLIGHGGFEKLVFKNDIPKPEPKDDGYGKAIQSLIDDHL